MVEAHRTREVYNWTQCFDVQTLTNELAANGLRVIEVCANVAGEPPKDDCLQMAVVAVPST